MKPRYQRLATSSLRCYAALLRIAGRSVNSAHLGPSEKTMSPDFIAAKAVLEGWQRAYERADQASLGVAVSALARLARADSGAGFNSGLRSALGSFLAGFAALCLEESLSV